MLDLSLTHRVGQFTLSAFLSIGPGVTTITGPSGAGKSTLLSLIAGLSRPTQGRILLNGQILVDTETKQFLAPHRRHVGHVFQEARLFPHLNVRHNLLYGRLFGGRGRPGPALDMIVDLLDIAPLLHRRPRDLSGGERQRVAIGRALLSNPSLLLLDEPLSALDSGRRAELLPYLRRLRDGTGLPMLYVTHQRQEVADLATGWVRVEEGTVRVDQ
ncbi:ATP-binding cassette domain-containing protein [Niveispirillum sp.]|uniref:ATP-binding cassette domain-containing protein n=1 Tax=Niveispirillum sp. TaxID=1917217 RepID=UPI001B52BBF8|nr:ATP-binding cassette domain-containing protein [Niveispirillum sp.]MBP7339797.1 ATP-binding cassette domain-containing protein [Niveispirillum sp.]